MPTQGVFGNQRKTIPTMLIFFSVKIKPKIHETSLKNSRGIMDVLVFWRKKKNVRIISDFKQSKKVLEPLTNTQWVDFLNEWLSKNYFFIILTFISSKYRHQNNCLLGHGIQAYLS